MLSNCGIKSILHIQPARGLVSVLFQIQLIKPHLLGKTVDTFQNVEPLSDPEKLSPKEKGICKDLEFAAVKPNAK